MKIKTGPNPNFSQKPFCINKYSFSFQISLSLHWREKRRVELMDDGLDGDQRRTARTFKIVWNVGRQLSPPATAPRGLTLEIVPVLSVGGNLCCDPWSSEPNIKQWAAAQLAPTEYSFTRYRDAIKLKAWPIVRPEVIVLIAKTVPLWGPVTGRGRVNISTIYLQYIYTCRRLM